MLKRSLYFTQPVYLHTRMQQLVVRYPEATEEKTVPIEDIGFIVVEDPQVSLSAMLMSRLMEHNVVVIHCNERHLPVGMSLSLNGHSEMSERVRAQIGCSLPLKKQLWQQIVIAKIMNQAVVLRHHGAVDAARKLDRYATEVSTGDGGHVEAVAATHYWRYFLQGPKAFQRRNEEHSANAYLNYGYAIVRAAVARALSGAGLLPLLGIYHKNKYNAYCLADDLMEPYRPFVDDLVWEMHERFGLAEELSTQDKTKLLQLLTRDVRLDQKNKPMMLAIERSATSLALCYLGSKKKLQLPQFLA